MRKPGKFRLLVALFLSLSLVAAACGDDDDEATDTTDDTADTEETTETDETDETTEEASGGSDCEVGEGDGVLKIGTVLPETGNLAFLGPPEFAAAELAVQDINAAGGVLDADVELFQGDSGDTSTDVASQTVDRHLNEGVDAFIGAASSGVSFTFIDKVTGACKIQFSPANTSPDFTDYDDNGLYFRTAPSDVLQGRVLADLVVADGNESATVMALQDPYGEGLLQYTLEPLEEQGVVVDEDFVYDPFAENFDAEVQRVVDADSDALVLIGFDESARILTGLFENGFTPESKSIYLVDGNVGNALGEQVSASMVGVKGTLPAAEITDEFRSRLLEVDPELEDFSYAPETYDAVVITALAALVAESDDAVAIAAEINGVTRDGETCTTFEECAGMIAEGTDIDYDGPSGPQTFGEAGEPSEASFAILQYGEGNTIDDSLTEYRFAQL
ncbi:MAG TPA: ABC transporter substrate-binding protein [Acidimicrobiales bacterium]|nr:ABC transporter substrate-binding protein [Acidimicrobiales bacterium]